MRKVLRPMGRLCKVVESELSIIFISFALSRLPVLHLSAVVKLLYQPAASLSPPGNKLWCCFRSYLSKDLEQKEFYCVLKTIEKSIL